MMRKPEDKKTVLDKTTVSRILRTIPSHEGFHFFRALGDSTEKIAVSLSNFVENLRIVDIRSIDFHFPRQDFEKWLRDIIGDYELSRRLSRIRKETRGEKLRSEIIYIVKGRIDELKRVQTKT